MTGITKLTFEYSCNNADENHELQPIVKGRGAKLLKKWLEELTNTLSPLKSVAEIGISYAGTNEWANEMKALLQPYVEKPISVLKLSLLFKPYWRECLGDS